MGSKRDTIVPEVECLPQEDLVDLYQKLADSYRTKKYENEEFLQQLHYLSQQSKVLVSSQNDLQQELENINTIHNEEIENLERKNVGIVENLREKSNELFNDKVYLESRVDELTSNLDELRKELTDVKLKLVQQKPAARVSDGFSRNLETENEQLQRLLNEATETVQESHSQRSVQASKIEELKEKLLCLEDNLETKKAEIEEKNDAIEGLQEKNNELTVEIAMLKSAPDEGGRKGNSLFAEVDDQRQKMKSILQGERFHYLDMKKSFNAKEMEIRRLKRENMNIKKEIQSCSNLLARGEQVVIESLTTRVNQLQNDNKNLEKFLAESERKLIDLAEMKNMGWIETMMTTSNNESREARDKLFNLMVQKNALADNFSKTQKELAKVRLDCVKLKVFLTRIIESNNLNINERDFLDIGLDEEVLESLKVEQLENTNEDESLESTASIFGGESLNESTINILGGRDRLGNFVLPSVKPKEENSVKRETSPEAEKENQASPEFKVSEIGVAKSSPLKPLQSIQPLEKEKIVTFSAVVESKVIDSTKEQFEESKQARKRAGVVVKHITIPSKGAAKSSR